MTHEEKIKEAVRELDECYSNVTQVALEMADSTSNDDKLCMEFIRDAVREWKEAGEKLHKLLRVPADITTAMNG